MAPGTRYRRQRLPRGRHAEKFCKQTDPRRIGFAVTPGREPVSMPASRSASICRLPDSCYGFELILLSRGSSSEYLRAAHLAGDLSIPASPALGFLSLFATSLGRVDVHSRGLPAPRFAPSSGFRNLSTASSAPELAGLFHPAATFRDPLVQGLLSPRRHPPSSEGACPLAVAAPPLTGRSDFRRSDRLPRAMPLDFEASICARPRFEGPVIHLASDRSPPRVFAPPGAPFSRRRLQLTRSVPLMVFAGFRPFTSSVLSSRDPVGARPPRRHC
jgi:hypothetical protein